MRHLHSVGLAALLCCSAAVAAETPYLFVIPAERLAGESGPLSEAVMATLHVPDATQATAIIAAGGALQLVAADDDKVTVAFGASQTLAGAPDDRDLADTFVIDYGEAPVAKVVGDARGLFGERPTTTELTEFVYRHIKDKAYLGTFDLASKVAARRAGDCTEHAVLLTALARANGYPARVAIGVVLIETEDDIAAFGHAWSEIYDGSGWHLADATRPQHEEQVVGVRYLPFISLDDEGPGFALDLARLSQIQPARLSRITNASPDRHTR